MTRTRIKSQQAFGGDGWQPAGAFTYSSTDAPTYVVTVASGAASIYGIGDRIKLTDSTVKYFIITAVTDTTLTLYGGTDYTLSGGAITLPYYSHSKIPLGFPLSPLKWAVKVTAGQTSTGTPTSGTWYNGTNIVLPIGLWDVDYRFASWNAYDDGNTISLSATLSTANNSESDSELTAAEAVNATAAGGAIFLVTEMQRSKTIGLTSKTTYYLNYKTSTAGIESIGFEGIVIRAICSYL